MGAGAAASDQPSRAGVLTSAEGIFQRADVVVHSVSTRRLRNFDAVDLTYFSRGQGRPTARVPGGDRNQFLTSIADATGGTWHTNLTDFARPLATIGSPRSRRTGGRSSAPSTWPERPAARRPR